MKTCNTCGGTKPLDAYARHHQMDDGHANRCKVCVKHHYERKRKDPEWVARERARHREKWHRLHENWNRDKGASRRAGDRWAAANRHKTKAVVAVGHAVRDGRLTKPRFCERCGTQPEARLLQGHHHDYSKLLDVEWLCVTCHRKEHWAA